MQASEQIPEKRMTHRLRTYWLRVKSDDFLPDYKRFNSDAVIEVWPQCFLVTVSKGDPIIYQMEYVGNSLQQMFGESLVGKMASVNIQSIPGATMIGDLDECVRAKDVILRQGTFVNANSKVVKYRSCMLPFGDANEEVDKIIVGVSWRAF